MILLGRKMKSSKYNKGQTVSSDAFCSTWVYLMNKDLLGITSKFPVQRGRVNEFKKLNQHFSKVGDNILCYSNMSPRVCLDPQNLGSMAFKAPQAVPLKTVINIGSSFLTTHQV